MLATYYQNVVNGEKEYINVKGRGSLRLATTMCEFKGSLGINVELCADAHLPCIVHVFTARSLSFFFLY